MDVQAELANAIKQRFQAVNGVEAPRQSGRSSRRRSPEPMPKADKAAKNEAKKAAAAAIMARMGGGKPASPPRAEKKKRSLKMPFSKPKISANVKNSTAKGPLSKQEEETAKKYRKMMKMGLPEGAVVHKMSQDGVSQRIVDAVLSGEDASPPPPPVSRSAKSSSSSSSRAALSPAEEKIAAQYRRMLKIKMPEGAVLHKMIADGVSAHIRDSVMAREEPARQTLPARGAGNQTKQLGGTTSSLSPKEEKIAVQYRRMLKIKMPEGAVKHKMVADGVSQKIQDSVMGGEVPASSLSSAPSSSSSSSRGGATGPVSSLSKEDELVAAPYRKMIKMKMPEGAVRHKMSVDRIPERIQKSVLNGEIPNENSHAAPPPGRRPANPMASAINMSGGIESLKKGPSSSRGHPMAAAISSSGGIGSLKKTPNQDAPARPPSNPMAAAIASSGGLKSLKKTSAKENKAPAAAPSNPIAAAIAASKGKNGLKKRTPNTLQPPKPKSSNSVLDELSSKGFQSGLRKTTPKTSPSTSPYSSPESSNSDSLADEPVPRRAPRASPDRDSSRPVNPRRSPERNRCEEDDRPRRSYGIRVKAIRPVGTTNETKEDDVPSRFSGRIKVKAIRPVGTSRFEEDDRPSRFSNIKVKAVRPVGTSRVEATPERNSKYETKEDDPPRRSYKVKSVRPTGVSSSVANEVPGKRISLNKEDDVSRNWRTAKTKPTNPPEEQPKSSTYIPYESKKNITQEKYESKKSITQEKYESKKNMQEKYPSRSTTCRSTASRSTASTKSTNSDFQKAANLEKNFASAVQESMRTQRTVPDYSGRSASRTKGRTSMVNHKNRSSSSSSKKKKVFVSKTGRKKRHVTTADGVDHHFQCIVM